MFRCYSKCDWTEFFIVPFQHFEPCCVSKFRRYFIVFSPICTILTTLFHFWGCHQNASLCNCAFAFFMMDFPVFWTSTQLMGRKQLKLPAIQWKWRTHHRVLLKSSVGDVNSKAERSLLKSFDNQCSLHRVGLMDKPLGCCPRLVAHRALCVQHIQFFVFQNT